MTNKKKVTKVGSTDDVHSAEAKEGINQGKVEGRGCGDASSGNPTPGYPKDLGSIIRAPLDTKNYKAIELENGLKAILVSTCHHEVDLSGCSNSVTASRCCKYQKIKEFNSTFLEIKSHSIPSDKSTCLGSICGPSEDECTPSCNDAKCNCRTNSSNDPEQIKDPKVIKCSKDTAAVTMCVGVGSFHNPVEIPGMAHLCEHCLFLGSKKYPQEGALFHIVNQANGSLNASTHQEYTSYYIYCPHDAFETVLDPFADMMTQPLLRPESINKEVESVDSEDALRGTNDFLRILDFMGNLSKQDHPMRKFTTGNKKTLKVKNLPEKMVEWHKRYYCANFMSLCLQGPFSIKELEDLAVKYFSNIRKTGLPHPRQDLLCFGDPFTPETFSKIYHIVPVSNIKELWVNWCFPADLWQDFQSKPLHYVNAVLSTKGKGGIYDYLLKKHWITDFNASCTTCGSVSRNTCLLYILFFVLTKEGLKNRDKILVALSSYIKMLCQQGSKRRIFEELKRTQASIWHYNKWVEITGSTKEMAVNLQNVPPKYVLTSKTLLMKYNKEQIDRVFNLMDLTQSIIIFVAREFSKEPNQKKALDGKVIYYTEKTISPEMQAEFKNVSVYSEFGLPAENTFLSQELKCPLVNEEVITIKGDSEILSYKSDRLLIQVIKNYQNEYTESLPSATYIFFIYSPLAENDKLPMMEMWTNLLTVFMRRRINNAFNSLIRYFFGVAKDNIYLHVQGPSFHLPNLIKDILEVFEEFQNLIVDSQYFEDYKTELIEYLENDTLDNRALSMNILQYLLLDTYRTSFHWIGVIKETSYADFCRYIKRYKSEMFIEILVSGSVTKSELDKVKNYTESLSYAAYNRSRPEVERAMSLPLGCKYLRIKAKHHAYLTSIVLNHYQFGCISDNNSIKIWDLFYKLLRRILFTRLRTEEQLGYDIQMGKWHESGCRGFTFIVITQPEKYTTEHVDSRIDKFIEDFYKIYFKDQKSFNALTIQYYPDKKFSFPLAKNMYKKYLLPTGDQYRKLSIQIVGFKSNATKAAANLPDSSDERVVKLEYEIPSKMVKDKGKFIMDIKRFKETLELQPNPEELDSFDDSDSD